MKFPNPNLTLRSSRAPGGAGLCRRPRRAAAFTKIEIAISLAIVSFGILAILVALPTGMNTQRNNREDTIIGQDATLLLEAIQNGARGMDDLTNYVYAITVTNPVTHAFTPYGAAVLTNGANIVGLLSTPVDNGIVGSTNDDWRVIALVHSMSGVAAEKPPQDNALMRDDTFSYQVVCVNVPAAVDTNTPSGYQLHANQYELRLSFLWPHRPNGTLGNGRQTFRATIAGQLWPDTNGPLPLYFYQPQSFQKAP